MTSSVFNLILTGVLKEIVNGCAEGQSVRELCVKADTLLAEETGKAFKKDKKVQKGNHFIESSQVSFTTPLEYDFNSQNNLIRYLAS